VIRGGGELVSFYAKEPDLATAYAQRFPQARRKRYAANLGTSVSKLVERYLDAVTRPRVMPEEEIPPALRRLRAIAKGCKFDREEHIDYLERKYR
jgi:hypothetical protein